MPYIDASVIGVRHDSSSARASGVGKKELSCASVTVSFQ
jgi:hypothetical protein